MSSSREAPELVHVTSTSAAHIAVSVMPPSDNMMLRWRSTVAKTWFKTLVRAPGARPAGLDQVADRRRDRQTPAGSAPAARAGGGERHADPGAGLLRALAGGGGGRAARDHGDAQARAGPRHAPAGALLRLDPDRDPDLAHHDRRRGSAEPGRHRPAAAHRRER